MVNIRVAWCVLRREYCKKGKQTPHDPLRNTNIDH
jgi:hypothetical protein